MTENLIEYSVFYAIKHFDNARTLEYAVNMMPLRSEHCTAYSFTVILSHGVHDERACIENVTCDRFFAENIFNKISSGNVFPCHLYDIIYDMLE